MNPPAEAGAADRESASSRARPLKIDIYTLGEPWDKDAFSQIPSEISAEFDRIGIDGKGYNMIPLDGTVPWGYWLMHLPYLRVGREGAYSIRDHHPAFLRQVAKRVGRTYRRNPKPDAVLMMPWGYPNFGDTPYFPYKDITIRAMLEFRERSPDTPTSMYKDIIPIQSLWKRESGADTDWLDKIPDPILSERMAIESQVYRDAAGVFATSDWVARTLRESYVDDPTKVHSVGIGHRYDVDEVRADDVADRFENPEVLFIGLDAERKGIDLLVDAYKRLDDTDTKLTVVTRLKQLPDDVRASCEADPNVELHDVLPPERLAPLYERASVFAMPSRFEPWGKVFFEAMSFGLPVIGADRCAMPEFIEDGHNGFVAPLDPSAIADRIAEVHTDPDAYAAMARNATDVAAEYTWENVADEMVGVIRKSIGERE